MNNTAIIGFYSHAHSAERMKKRIDNAVKQIEDYSPGLDFLGYVSDHCKLDENNLKDKLNKNISQYDNILFILAGWVESTAIINILSDCSHKPLIVLSLAGYYTDNGLIAPAGAAAASLLRPTLEDLNIEYEIIYQNINEPIKVDAIVNNTLVNKAIRLLKNTKIASIGYACSNLYPFMYDGSLIKTAFGVHVDNIELLEIKQLADKVTQDAIKNFTNDFMEKVCFKSDYKQSDIRLLGKYVVALVKIIEENDYKGITIKCGSGPGALLGFTPCIILSYISKYAEVICEGDVYGLLLQVIIKTLTGNETLFLEIFEFYKDRVLMACCGHAPFSFCKGKKVLACSHDWDGSGGIMNISELKTGIITLSSLYKKNGKFFLYSTTANARNPEKFQEEGWKNEGGPKIPALEIKLDQDLKEFQNNIYSPHFIISYGDITENLKKYCQLSNIEFISS